MKKQFVRFLALALILASFAQIVGASGTDSGSEGALEGIESGDSSGGAANPGGEAAGSTGETTVTFSDSDISIYDENGNNLRYQELNIAEGQTVRVIVDLSVLYSKLVQAYGESVLRNLSLTYTIYYSANGLADLEWVEGDDKDYAKSSFDIFGTGTGRTEVTLRTQISSSGTLVHDQTYTLMTVYANEPEPEPDPEPEMTLPTTYTLPSIDIASAVGTVISGYTVALPIGEKTGLVLAVNTTVWQEDTKLVDGKPYIGYFSQDALGNYYYLDTSAVQWKLTGSSSILALTDGSSGVTTANVEAKSKGSTAVTVSAPCRYLAVKGDTLVDQGNVGTLSASAVCDVQEQQYKNPFAGIDPSKVENPFPDIPKKAWYYDYVMYLYAAGFYDGLDFGDGKPFSAPKLAATGSLSFTLGNLGDAKATLTPLAAEKKTYNPNARENRANTVHTLYNGHKSIGGIVGSYTKNKFSDVSSSKAYYQAVLWATSTKTVNGYGGGKFGPADGITREQFCAILVRYANHYGFQMPTDGKVKTFTDNASISSWAKDAVVACQKAGIINGMTDGSFRPKDGITRAQISAMIYRFINNCVGEEAM